MTTIKSVNSKFRDILKAKAASEDELRAYQDRLSKISKSKWLRETPRTKSEEIEFSRLLFKHEPYVSASIEILIEGMSTDSFKVTRRDSSEGTVEADDLTKFLNWYLNDYFFEGEFHFPLLWNTQGIDWFVAGEELYHIDSRSTAKWEGEQITFKYPTNIVPISPEFLAHLGDTHGFGIPTPTYQIKVPEKLQQALKKNPNFTKLFGDKRDIILTGQEVILLKRMAKLSDARGKSLVDAAHEPVRTKYLKIAEEITQARISLIKEMVFIKYGETGEDGLERDFSEMEELANAIKNNMEAGLAMAVVPPDVNIDSVKTFGKTDGDAELKAAGNADILAGLRMFSVLLNGVGLVPAGFKEIPLTMIKEALDKARRDRLMQFMPRLVNKIIAMNAKTFKDAGITADGLRYTLSEITLQSLERIRLKLKEWEDGLWSTEDYHGPKYPTVLENKKRELKEEPNTFNPRQLSHTLSGTPNTDNQGANDATPQDTTDPGTA